MINKNAILDFLKELNLSPETVQDQQIDDLLKDIYSKSLYHFIKFGLGYKDLAPDTHKPICYMLQSQTKKKLLVVPRGCFKSTIASVAFPIWLLTKDFNKRILIDSELYTNSSTFLREIKGHLRSERMTSLYGQFESNVWNESEIIVKQRTKILKEASITASGIGAQKTSQHYDIIIADDLNSLSNSMTHELRQKVINHYKLYISLLDPGGTIVVIGTRYADDDLIGHIHKNEIEPKKGLL